MSDHQETPPKGRTASLRERFPEMPHGATVVFQALREGLLKGLAEDEAAEAKEREAKGE